MKRAAMALPFVFLSMLVVPPASATTYKDVDTLNTSIVTCSGERLSLTGEGLIIAHILRKTDGTFHASLSLVERNVTGKSATGVTYREASAGTSSTNVNYTGTVSVTGEQQIILISENGDPNLHIRYTFHFTINAKGVATVYFENFHSICLG